MEDEDGDQKKDNGEYERLVGMSVNDILREGQKALFARLVGLCRSGSASHQEMAILRNILKDNGLVLGIPPEKAAAVEAAPVDLPRYEDPEYLQ